MPRPSGAAAGLTAVALACLVGCGSHVRATPASAPKPPIEGIEASALPPTRDGQLPPTVIPRAYTLALTIDPNAARFSGEATILVEVPQPARGVVVNARGMKVGRVVAHARGRPESEVSEGVASDRGAPGGAVAEELAIEFRPPIPTGTADIVFDYDAPFAPDLAGLYRLSEQGVSYAFSQFESTDARRAFPCFDEPGYKTPFDVRITAPRGLKALSNAPEAGERPGPNGTVTHIFRRTPPLPTYLVAFAVGDFDVVDGPKDPVPLRVVTTKGRAKLAAMAFEVTQALLTRLIAYFGLRYPYDKLDLVAVPDFAAGAMENAGLITFRDGLLLIDPEHTTTSARRAQAEVIAHELAHQWVGDLVTMRWWDDLWLNEGFATWAEAKIVDAWQPSFGATIEQIADAQHVMDSDALEAARAVRQPVRSTGEAREAFDGITYEKGAAVLRMLEGWLGEDTFRRGIQHYLEENAWKNARAADLFRALDFVSAQHVGELVSPFLDQPGVPLVTGRLRCGPRADLELDASEWRPLGRTPRGLNEPPRSWTLPVCVATDAQKSASCFTLGAEPITRSLGTRCPAWVSLNAELSGYYRAGLDQKEMLTLARASRGRDPRERLGVLSNAWAAVRDGSLDPGALLEVVASYDADTNRFVVDEIASILSGIDRALVTDRVRAGFERLVSARLAPRARSLGWLAKADEEDDDRLERRTVLWALGDIASDPAVLDAAAPFAERWLADATSVSEDVAAVAVPLSTIRAGEGRLTLLRRAVRDARVPQDRTIAVRAMGMFDDERVLRSALDLTLTGELKISEVGALIGSASSRRTNRARVFAWEKEHWPALEKRLPGALVGGLAGIVAGACDDGERAEERDFFVPALKDVEGAKRGLDQALESAALCAALRTRFAGPLTAWIAAHPIGARTASAQPP